MLPWTPEGYRKTLLFIPLECRRPEWPDLWVVPGTEHLGLPWLSPPLLEFFETVWFSWISSIDIGRDDCPRWVWSFFCGVFAACFWRLFVLATFGWVFLPLLLRLCIYLSNQLPLWLCSSVGCNFCWSWLGSPINSCRSEVFCAPGNIPCDSEVVQMLFIYADILWALRFMFQRETEDILRVAIACLASCLFWEIRVEILFHRT